MIERTFSEISENLKTYAPVVSVLRVHPSIRLSLSDIVSKNAVQ